ncbi:Pentatricopeptide repeat-containing protein [Capsicum baccatum]|uniref:Pentatricopeptide repeat-containing protein n=1 Tax=Capsicum baccatum TaxID=33114 RepID=A0A2G2WYW1_CAPBA|nr:Pentatricopeptide repeat-containing protein [Capsicum baccatum]
MDMGLARFRQMDERTVVSWNLMIFSLAQNGRAKEALTLFHEMRNSEFEPDEATVVTVLPDEDIKLDTLYNYFYNIDPIVIGLNFKCALDSEKAFEALYYIKQEQNANRNSPRSNLYGRVVLEDDYTPKEAVGEYL